MLPELAGSYEETPPCLIDLATRDRRWAQGNLQHIKIVGAKGLHWVSRVHLVQGIMSYLASPLWLMLLMAGLILATVARHVTPNYFPDASRCFPAGRSSTPNWPSSSSPSPSPSSTCRSFWRLCWHCATANCGGAAAASWASSRV
jgi:membrane glycosyltransferase